MQFSQMRFIPAPELLQRLAGLPVQPRTAEAEDGVIERLADQRMHESVAAGCGCRPDQPRRFRFLQRLQHLLTGTLVGLLQGLQRELAPDYDREREQVSAGGRQIADSSAVSAFVGSRCVSASRNSGISAAR
ncbi:MAG: hypothetical protein ACR2PL_23095 [Dehalococcoidia bacterium]